VRDGQGWRGLLHRHEPQYPGLVHYLLEVLIEPIAFYQLMDEVRTLEKVMRTEIQVLQ